MEQVLPLDTPRIQPRLDYFSTLAGLIRRPRQFFAELPATGWGPPTTICAISALFHSAVSFTYIYGRSWPLALALLANAVCMPLCTAALARILLTMALRQRVSLERLYAVVALAGAPVLLISWVPLLGLLTEPWRLGLITIGFRYGCNLSWRQALFLTAATFAVLLLLFWSALPLLADLRQWALTVR